MIEGRESDRRRREIADALLRIASRGGLDAVTVRLVAREAGYSVGMVQRHVSTKDEMLLLGMRRYSERIGERIRQRIAGVEMPGVQELLRVLAVELLESGHTYRDEGVLWLAFASRASISARVADELKQFYVDAADLVVPVLGVARDAGELRTDVGEIDRVWSDYLAIVDGYTQHLLIGRIEFTEAKRAIDTFIRNLFVRQ